MKNHTTSQVKNQKHHYIRRDYIYLHVWDIDRLTDLIIRNKKWGKYKPENYGIKCDYSQHGPAEAALEVIPNGI